MSVNTPKLRALCVGLGGICLVAVSGLASGCNSSEPSAQEALKAIEEKKLAAAAAPVSTKPPPPPPKLAKATPEELAAWDRKDPAGEAHLYKWDKKNLKRMGEYWKDLSCFRREMMKFGEAAKGTEPGSPEFEKWERFKGGFIPFINRWQQRLFSNEPRILEKSKFISKFLALHEVIMVRYPRAYNMNDEVEKKKADAFWILESGNMMRYVKQLGGKWPNPDFSNPKESRSWDKRCKKALTEPKKGKKRRRRGP